MGQQSATVQPPPQWSKEKELPITCEPVTQLLLAREESLLPNFFLFILLRKKVLCSAILIFHLMYLCICTGVIAKAAITGHQGASASNNKVQQEVTWCCGILHDKCFNGVTYKCFNTIQTQSFTIPGPFAAMNCSNNFPVAWSISPCIVTLEPQHLLL